MINVKFNSLLSGQIQEFIKFKFDFGHDYEKQTYHLKSFDDYCLRYFPQEKTLNKEMVLGWATLRPNEGINGFKNRLCTIRQFGKYLALKERDTYILPDGLKGGKIPLPLYVFLEFDLQNFFIYVDNMEHTERSSVRHLVAPMMFRYMYCCGLRPKEARVLQRSDVNLDTGRIFIRESKHHKERIVYARPDLMQMTKQYLPIISSIFPDCPVLFPDRDGKMYSYHSQQYLFNHCRKMSGIHGNGTNEPNLYSFRHTFATYRIYQWFKEGKDLATCLPRLGAYMGHEDYRSTLYYLHFVPQIFTEMSGFNMEQFSHIIPEVEVHE